jgi:hypothetical protein
MLLSIRESGAGLKVVYDAVVVGRSELPCFDLPALLEVVLECERSLGGITEVEFMDYCQAFREILHGLGYGEQYLDPTGDQEVVVSFDHFVMVLAETVYHSDPDRYVRIRGTWGKEVRDAFGRLEVQEPHVLHGYPQGEGDHGV